MQVEVEREDPFAKVIRRAEPRVEVESRYESRDESYIPRSVFDAFAAQGKRVTLASSWPNAQSQIAVNDRYPLVKEDLDTIARPKREPSKKGESDGDEGFDPHRVMKVEGSFRLNSDGYYMRGDCIVYIQSHDAYQYQVRKAAEMWERQDDPATHEAHYRDLFAPHGKVGPNVAGGAPIGRISDYINRLEEA